jgi:HD-like signal output (HDOD) protein
MTASKEQFFENLWAQMDQHGDFPTLQYSIDNLVSALGTEANTGALATKVLADFSLAQKVLRLSNSAMYSSFGGEVTTISRAILVLGVDAVGHLALGLQLLDNFSGAAANYPHAADELKRAIVAGELARALSASQGINQGEEAVVCTLMHHLSRLLLAFYFPEQWVQVQTLSGGARDKESDACVQVFGVSLEEVAEAAALKWKMPDVVAATMKHNAVDAESVAGSHSNWLGAMATVSSRAAELVSKGAGPDEVRSLLESHAEALGLNAASVAAAADRASSLKENLDHHKLVLEQDRRQVQGKHADAAARLNKTLSEVKLAANATPVSELVPLVMESAMRAVNFTHCFVMFLNHSTKRYAARLGFGPGVSELLPALTFEEGFVPDVFHFSITANKSLFLENTKNKEFAHRIPRWYRDSFPDVTSMVITPVYINNRCVALFCGDWGNSPEPVQITSGELSGLDQLMGEIGKGLQRNLTRG